MVQKEKRDDEERTRCCFVPIYVSTSLSHAADCRAATVGDRFRKGAGGIRHHHRPPRRADLP